MQGLAVPHRRGRGRDVPSPWGPYPGGRPREGGSGGERGHRNPLGSAGHVHSHPLNPCELEIDLFCSGIRIDSSCTISEDGRAISRTRAGLGSGLELVLPGRLKDIWLNVPVEEDFARASPYRLEKLGTAYVVTDERFGWR